MCLATFCAVQSHAQNADPAKQAEATRLFDEGNALYEQSNWKAAEAKLQASWDLVQAPDTAANLGDCELYEKQYRDAAEHLAFALRSLPLSTKDEVRKRIQERFDVARREVAAVRVEVSETGAVVKVNAREVGRSPLAGDLYLDPGQHEVAAELPGFARVKQNVATTKGGEAAVKLVLVADPAVEAPRGGRSMAPVIVGGVVAAAGLVAGTIFVIAANAKADDIAEQRDAIRASNGRCGPARPAGVGDACSGLEDATGSHNGLVAGAVVSYVAAGVGLGFAGIYWAASGPSARDSGVRVKAAPAVGLGTAGLRVTGSF